MRRLLAKSLVRCPALVFEYLSGGSVRGAMKRKAGFLQPPLVRLKVALDAARVRGQGGGGRDSGGLPVESPLYSLNGVGVARCECLCWPTTGQQ